MSPNIKDLITPSIPKVAEYFGVPYHTLYRWSLRETSNWRFRMYVYLVDRYKKEMK